MERDLAAKKSELEQLNHQRRRNQARREQLLRQVEEVERQLADAKVDRKETERERKAAEAVAQLLRTFEGRVFGRLTDVSEVT